MPQFNIPEEVKEVVKKFEKSHFEIYIVGGAVRDLIMGKIPNDWDFTTNATPQEILKVLGEKAYYDNKFGTVGLPSLTDLDPFEITTFRTESDYKDARRPEKVVWGKSLEEDLKRRDFTINAMAIKINGYTSKDGEPTIIDPYEGQKDIKTKTLRAVGDPNERFGEDALRMMRAIRIASQLNFKIEKTTLDAISANVKLINKISKERIKDELFKTLISNNSYEGILAFKESGLMEEVLPEVYKMFGVEQKSPGRHHIYDVGTHCLMALKFVESEDPVTRFATLIHDIGKPQTLKKLETGTITFYNHEVIGAKIAERIADRLKFSNREKEKLITLVRFHQFSVNEFQTDSAVRRFIRNVGVTNIEDMIALRTADRLGSGAAKTSWRTEDFKRRIIEVQKQPFSVNDLKIDGNDVMRELKLTPGPRVGEVLSILFKEVEEKRIENERVKLLDRLHLL